MLTMEQIDNLIKQCREIAERGLANGTVAHIPELNVDVLTPPNDFMGVLNNPAIFVNQKTSELLGSFHPTWIADRTIAIKSSFLNHKSIEMVGAIIHETGHAFNVAAKIKNTETNAYLFEIELIFNLLDSKGLSVYGCSAEDVDQYFNSRLSFYNKETTHSEELKHLVEKIRVFSASLVKKESPSFEVEPIVVPTSASVAPSRHSFFAVKERESPSLVAGQIKSKL